MKRDYEKSFAKAVGLPHAYAFWKGRVALYAILRALGIGPGDEVLVPGFTCVVVPNAVRFTKATPVYVDIASGSYNIDPERIEDSITPRCRAIVVQHTFGIPANLDAVTRIARKRRLAVIEDCAHALGSTYRGLPLGQFGEAAFFSSQWSKPFTTGLGGVAVTSDENIANNLGTISEHFESPATSQVVKLRVQYGLYRRLFSPRLYWQATDFLRHMSRWNLFVGSSNENELASAEPLDKEWRMSAFQARAGLRQLAGLSANVEHRRTLGRFYEDYLKAHGWDLPVPPQHS